MEFSVIICTKNINVSSGMMTFILLQLSVLSFYLWVDFTKYTINSAMSEENCERYGFKGSEQARAINFVLSGCVNMVGVVLTSVLCRVVGRRPTLILEMLACLVVLILWIAMPDQRVVVEICSYIVRWVLQTNHLACNVQCCKFFNCRYMTPNLFQ